MGTELYADWPVGELDDFHSFREKKYKYIYLCLNCSRSFETIAPTNKCKFCSGNIKRLAPIPTTEDYTVEHDIKRRAKRILLRAIRRYLKPIKSIDKGSQKTLQERYPVVKERKIIQPAPKVPMDRFPRIFSRRNKEELPTR